MSRGRPRARTVLKATTVASGLLPFLNAMESEGAKADAEVALQAAKEEKKATETALMNLNEVIRDLHQECDWLLDNYDLRKTRVQTKWML